MTKEELSTDMEELPEETLIEVLMCCNSLKTEHYSDPNYGMFKGKMNYRSYFW